MFGMPADYPEDIPVYPGLRGIHGGKMGFVYTLVGGTTDTPKQVAVFFNDALPKNGWIKVDPSEVPEEGVYIEYTKGQRTLRVSAGTGEKLGITFLVVSDFYEQPQ